MLSKSAFIKIYIFVLFLIASLQLEAKCRLSLSSVKPVVFNWEGNSEIVRNSLVVSRSKKGKNKCKKFHITMDRGSSYTYRPRYMKNGSSQLAYNIYSKRNLKNIVFHHPLAFTKSRVISTKFKKNETSKTIFYWSKVESYSDFMKLLTGEYIDKVVTRVYEGKLPSLTQSVHDSAILNVTTYLRPVIDLSLVSTGGPFDRHDTYESLNYGNLVKGESRGFDIRVKSNTPYKILFSSQNDGYLQENTNGSKIMYYLKVKGILKDLAGSSNGPVEVARGIETGAKSGVFPVSIEIGSVKNKVSGLYQDIIQVEVVSI